MATYYDLLEVFKTTISELPGWTAGEEFNPGTVDFQIYKRPEWSKSSHRLFSVILAPREDLDVDVVDLIQPNSVVLGYEIFVGFITDMRYSHDLLKWRMDRLQEMLQALWKPLLAVGTVSSSWDVDFNPKPGFDTSWRTPEVRDMVDDVWRSFTVKTLEARSV